MRLPTLLVTLIILTTYFSPFAQPVAAASSSATTTISRGMRLVENPDGSRAVSLLPTFHKSDGTHQLLSSLDFASGNWPYGVQQGPTSLTLSRLGKSSTQGKIPSATYEFLPTTLKETINISDAKKVPGGSLTVPLASTYQIQVSGLTIKLLDASGTVIWQTANFTAWDSAQPPHKFPTPVTALTYASGVLTMVLDSTMLAQATYPLHVDPTWVLKADAFNNWQGTLDHVTSDWGDHKLKIGNFADNFAGNTNTVWTVYSGSLWFPGNGRAELRPGTEIRTNTVDSWSNLKLHYTANFVATGGFAALFRYQDANNYYLLDFGPPVQSLSSLRLSKVVGGVRTDISPALSVNQQAAVDYDFMLVARRISPNNDYFEIWFNGLMLWSGYDSQGVGVLSFSAIGFRTYGSSTVDLTNVRTWSPTRNDGVYTTLVRDSGVNVPTQAQFLGAAEGYNSVDLWINSSWDSTSWVGWHVTKSMGAPGFYLQTPDLDWKRYYQIRAVLRTGNNGTASVGEIDITEGPPPIPAGVTNTGRQPWSFYVGGMVNGISGNLFFSSADLSIRAKGFTLAVARAYNSKLSTNPGPFGLGTTHNFNANLAFPTAATSPSTTATGRHIASPPWGGVPTVPRGESITT